MSTPELDHDQLPVGLLLLDARQTLLRVNAHVAELVGRPVDELLGRRIDELLAPASRLLFHSHIVPALQLHRRVDEVELTLLTPGPRQAAMFHAVLDQDAQGEQRIHAVLMRLGERRRLEEPLRPAQRAADQLPGMLFQLLLNAQGVWAMPYASDGLRRLHGLMPELVREQLGPWWGSLHPQDRSTVEAGLRASADALVDWRARYRSLAGRRELWVQSRATPQRLADGSVLWHGYSEDITELLQQEQAHQQQLAADAVNRAMSEFLTTMSDEIRTPLHAMLGLTEQLQRDRPSAGQVQQLARIADCGRHLLEVVNNVLDVTRIEAGRFELDALDFDLAGLCEQVLQQVADPARSKGLQLSLDLADTPLAWCGDVARLRQALLNLASNAVQFTERGTVQMRVRLQPASRVDQTGARLLQFELIDSGSGLDAPALARLFEPFAQADRSITRHPGRSGLGLVITRRLARLMHGDAGASSTPGVGSRFWFTARLVPGTPSSAAPAGASELEAQLRRRAAGLRVLVADDHPLNRELTADLLGAVQLGVDLACDGLQALTLVEQADPPHALVLMDLQMPQLDGLAATRAIRRLPGRANLPIIAMTAKALDSDRAACLDAGMNDFIAKPVDLAQLYATVLRWLPGTSADVPAHSGAAAAATDPAASTASATADTMPTAPPATRPADAAPRPDPASTPPSPDPGAGLEPLDELGWRTRLLAVPGLDAARGLYQVRDRLPAYLRVLGVFTLSLHKGQTELQAWLTEQSQAGPAPAALPATGQSAPADHLNALVHRIKGSAAAVGAMGLHGHALRAESLIRSSGPGPELRQAITILASEAGLLASLLDTMLGA